MLPSTDTCEFISTEGLAGLLKDGKIRLIDVRTEEAWSECHISGSTNLCIYETAFPEKMAEFEADKAAPIVIYGEGHPFKADLAAYASLQSQGYTEVSILTGGLKAWKEEGREIEGSGPADDAPRSRHYFLDTEKSHLRWVGRNLMNQHNGEIQLAGGEIKFDQNGILAEGEVIADMTKMVCHDIKESKMAQALIGHLASVDFFDVENHPEARFNLDSGEPIKGALDGAPNLLVKGQLTARGTSMPLETKAMLAPIEGGFVLQTVFQFDRTQVGALYGSGRIFERLGMHLVNDLVSIDLTAFFIISKP
ncbi:sulfurtransferase [Puniceicoccales bacterium CK1056]|uniref:Sulfurtransferase n=1 Tax=Oceanipulchritudo coccoides TaxID=2706888 RepID=A0A6B2M1L0_9BACT|nr:rhodanese-like domain-containing protein [Oceanipulchritudo coccoides]NDV61967.1 sulfurtransferase [Oceanipulchritudo coccoides]